MKNNTSRTLLAKDMPDILSKPFPPSKQKLVQIQQIETLEKCMKYVQSQQ